jgi:hypothetical protein
MAAADLSKVDQSMTTAGVAGANQECSARTSFQIEEQKSDRDVVGGAGLNGYDRFYQQ